MLRRKLAQIVSVILAVLSFSVLVSGCDGTGRQIELAMYETELAKAEAVRDDIRANIEQTRLETEQAKAELERAKGERELMAAAARSVDSDRQLVEYYAHRGDNRALLLMVSLLGLVGCFVGLSFVLRRRENEKTNAANYS